MSHPRTPSDTDSLPVTADDSRSYVRIQPTAEALDAETVVAQFRRLHQVRLESQKESFLDRFRGSPSPTLEALLVSDGEETTYYVGVDTQALDATRRILRSLFPDGYEFSSQTWAPDRVVQDSRALAAVEYCGRVSHPKDWQTRLTKFESFLTDATARVPLAGIVEAMAESPLPMVYQILLRPRADWSGQRAARVESIENQHDHVSDQLTTALFGAPEEVLLTQDDEERLEELASRDPRRSFDVNARLVVAGKRRQEPADALARDLADALSHVSHTCYEVTGRVRTGSAAEKVLQDVRERTLYQPKYGRLSKMPWRRPESPGLVVDVHELGSFCLLDGAALTADGTRSVDATPGERRSVPQPPQTVLDRYRGAGLALGNPLTTDGTVHHEPVVLPPALQPMHVAWFGKTGSGKSTALTTAMLENHRATDGASILIDPKGDGMATDYLRAHFARYGHLENVLYFDCSQTLPAFSFFDIRDQLAAGVPRTTAVEDSVDHYLEILGQVMGVERFERAVRSPDIIRYLVKALYDPVSGSDAYAHRDLETAVRQLHERQTAPAVSDASLEQLLAGVVANKARSFDEIMQGVANRIEKIPVDQRLARIFNHVPGEGDAHFDLADYLDENVVIVLDTGSLRPQAQRVLTLVVLSNLWTALRRRAARADADERPLVNLYVEEAASVAISDLLKELLAQARGFGCSVTLAMQFPGQLRRERDVYDEILNNVSTVVTGNVPSDRELARRLATEDMDATEVGNRLRALRRGQWLVKLPAGFGLPEPRPFTVASLPPPPGHPAGAGLSQKRGWQFEETFIGVENRTLVDAGLALGQPSTTNGDDDPLVDDAEASSAGIRVDTALPYTKRLPPTVDYEEDIHALRCSECNNRYDPSSDGMVRAIECCSSLDSVDPDDIPICALNLKLTPEEMAVSQYSVRQLMFLQAVYNAQQLRYAEPEYDLLNDTMLRLQEYVGIESDSVQDLIDDGLLSHDTDHPHRLFTVTPDGRGEIGESYREGIDYGHGKGDLQESSQHVFAVQVTTRYLEQEYAHDPGSDVDRIVPYYDLDENRRLDIAGLDRDGDIVLAVEVERINHDLRRSAPDDYDKMAACEPEEAIWIVMTHADGHELLAALREPLEGEPRVEKTYSDRTAPYEFSIDRPGMTKVFPVEYLRGRLKER
ncbi:ATP-binding protein [Haloarchaeobius sp. DYHT-AS-18]|uniref:ATP-binding protein n=1 Tax=Haloarchaeobius sp. DYHT-AS-18 TaxID=3446117 RepID=UPI003EBA99A6